MLTTQQLRSISPTITNAKATLFLPVILRYQGEVSTPWRFAAFLANLIHESGSFIYMKELASGEAYEGRKDLGNDQPGDGKKYKGRSPMQITGKANYLSCSMELFGDNRLVIQPQLLEDPEIGVRASYWFWNRKNLNDPADRNDFLTIVKKINGGTNGLKERTAIFNKALPIVTAAMAK